MTKYALLLASLFITSALPGQARLLVAGNTADAEAGFYRALQRGINEPGDKATVLFAGDYIPACTDEMVEFDRKEGDGQEVFPTLQPLLELIRNNPETNFYLIPGDRDWDKSGKNGLTCVNNLERYLEDQDLDNLHWPLSKGCPGPEFVDLTPTATLMLVNTQWWNHPYTKPVPADADCNFSDPTISMDEIVSAIEENQDVNMIIAGHYPPKSQGRFGGKFPARDHFNPLPVVGSVRLSYRQNIGTPEELTNRRFDTYAAKIKDYNSQFTGLMFIGAQDKSQQLLGFGQNFILNAGAAADGRWVAKHKPAMHTSREPGFTELHYAADGSVTYRYVLSETGETESRQLIYHAPCEGLSDTLPSNPAFPPCLIDSLGLLTYSAPSSPTVTTAAGPQYARSGFAEFFLGEHYRDVWVTPVKYPVLNLSEFPLDLKPERQGGGRQTTSLKMNANNGESYVFRSIDKDPSGTFSYEIRNTIVADAVRDQTSSGHPYGNLIIAPLLDEIDILHANPSLYIMAPGKALGNFNPVFGNLKGTLELTPKGKSKKKGRPGSFGADDVLKSFELFRERYDDQEVLIDHREFLRARMFDLLIGDWSKHEDNWKWGQFDVGEEERIRPIPRDRDNAFSRLDGFFPWLASRRWAVPNLEDFNYRQPDIRSLTFQARHMDRLLLSPLSRADYRAEAKVIQSRLTDDVLAAAVNQVPAPAIAPNESGSEASKKSQRYLEKQAEVLDKLKVRRDDLLNYADEYYELHATTVDIVGTNDEEEFLLEAAPDGRLTVTSTDLKGKSEGKILYQRTFLPSETKEVRIYGLGDDDQFKTVGDVGKRISVRLIGGQGENTYVNAAESGPPARVRVYDKAQIGITPAPGFRNVNNWRPELYYYDRTSFKYNNTSPLASVGYNSFSGATLGVGFVHTRRNFTKTDYNVRYRLLAQGGTLGNAALEGGIEWGEVIRWADVVVNTRIGRPDFYNFFFGLGNNTVKVPDVRRAEFNLISLDHFSVEGGLRRTFADRSYFNIMTGYQNNKTTNREGTILDRDDRFYGDGDFVFGYVRPEFRLDLRDHPVFPSKGVLIEGSHKQAYGRKNAVDFGVSQIAGEIHISTRRFPISLSLRSGYARSSGRAPFYELPALGRNNGLRGFQRNRFVGDGYFFYNTEFRTPLALIRSRIVPFAIGIRAFYDRGKILDDSEPSDFKSSYGGGVYIVPASRSFTVSALLGFSDEESALVQVGLGTNF